MQPESLTLRPTTCSPKSERPASFYVVREASDIRWRVELPVRYLKAQLVQIRGNALTEMGQPSFEWYLTDDGASYPNHEGVAVFTRPCMARAIHASAMKANGVRTLAELDDNMLSDPNQNIFMRINGFDTKNRRTHLQAFASFDGIVFSTAWLRDEYLKTFKKELRYTPPAYVARNHVDVHDWETRVPLLPPAKKIRVGWAGSHQHIWDLRLAAPALHLAKEMGCELVFIGLDPATHDPKWRDFLGDYTFVPWTTPKRYHKTKINIDVGLIPLVMNKHTLGKSDVKSLEYGMSGAAIVAQNNPVYNKTLIHNETALLVGGPDEMALAVAELIRHPRLRERLTGAMKQYILEERTMQKQGLAEWKAALDIP